jgi:hypothetical protein
MEVHRRAVVAMSTLVKVMIGLVTGVLVLGTLAWWTFEQEYGGQDAVSGVAIGHLADGTAELREITWPGLDPEASTGYEVADEGDVVVVRFVDHGGAVLFSGTADEVDSWLDEQGPQLYAGTYDGAIAYRRDLQESGQDGFPVWMIPIWFVPILTAVIASRRSEEKRMATTG